MTHLRHEVKAAKGRKSDCKKGLHLFGETQNIGAGIARRVCARCKAVTIDLTQTFELGRPVTTTPRALGSWATRDS